MKDKTDSTNKEDQDVIEINEEIITKIKIMISFKKERNLCKSRTINNHKYQCKQFNYKYKDHNLIDKTTTKIKDIEVKKDSTNLNIIIDNIREVKDIIEEVATDNSTIGTKTEEIIIKLKLICQINIRNNFK